MGIKLGVVVIDSDVEWDLTEFTPYRYNATLYHKPTDSKITQASEKSEADAKSSCLRELRWRLKNWKSYKESLVR